jgi:hypothetical protein
MSKNIKNNSNKNISIKQILILIFFILLIGIGIFINNNYNEVSKNINDIPSTWYTLDTIPKYTYEGNNLVASGITIEAESVEDKGKSICFYVYIYNVQPGVIIDYATGESKLAE